MILGIIIFDKNEALRSSFKGQARWGYLRSASCSRRKWSCRAKVTKPQMASPLKKKEELQLTYGTYLKSYSPGLQHHGTILLQAKQTYWWVYTIRPAVQVGWPTIPICLGLSRFQSWQYCALSGHPSTIGSLQLACSSSSALPQTSQDKSGGRKLTGDEE